MDMATQYPVGQYFEQMEALLGVAPDRVLRRTGLSPSLSDQADLSVTAETFFRIWDAMIAEANRPGVEMDLAMAYAHGPFLPPIFAFSCADTLSLGLQRLADFKPLIGPLTIEVSRPGQKLRVDMRPSEARLTMPPSMALFEILYITECARCFSCAHVVPVETCLPGPLTIDKTCLEFLGHTPKTSNLLSMTFSVEDADRPLITRSPPFWESLQTGFQDQLEDRMGAATMSAGVKKTLTGALPGGSTSVEAIAKRLNVSKRSLQRRLSEEGTSFKALLNETRFEMSDLYLKDSGLSVPEISYLLGFRETSSFFRAFQGWTGMTPGDYRASGASSLNHH